MKSWITAAVLSAALFVPGPLAAGGANLAELVPLPKGWVASEINDASVEFFAKSHKGAFFVERLPEPMEEADLLQLLDASSGLVERIYLPPRYSLPHKVDTTPGFKVMIGYMNVGGSSYKFVGKSLKPAEYQALATGFVVAKSPKDVVGKPRAAVTRDGHLQFEAAVEYRDATRDPGNKGYALMLQSPARFLAMTRRGPIRADHGLLETKARDFARMHRHGLGKRGFVCREEPLKAVMLANGWSAYTAVFACRKVTDAPWVYQPLTVFDPGGLLYVAVGIGVAPKELNAIIGGGKVIEPIPPPPAPVKAARKDPKEIVVEEEPPPDDYIRGKAVIFFTVAGGFFLLALLLMLRK